MKVERIPGPDLNCISAQHEIDSILAKYPTFFGGVGKPRNYQLKMHVNQNIPPVAQPPRRVPFHLRKAVHAKLRELEDLDVIESVQGPTPGSHH